MNCNYHDLKIWKIKSVINQVRSPSDQLEILIIFHSINPVIFVFGLASHQLQVLLLLVWGSILCVISDVLKYPMVVPHFQETPLPLLHLHSGSFLVFLPFPDLIDVFLLEDHFLHLDICGLIHKLFALDLHPLHSFLPVDLRIQLKSPAG